MAFRLVECAESHVPNESKHEERVSAAELAAQYGSLDLLEAYLIRNFGMTPERAQDLVYKVDTSLELMLDEVLEDEDADC